MSAVFKPVRIINNRNDRFGKTRTNTWTLINPLLQYFGGQAILTEYSLKVPGIQLSPAFELSGMGIFIGLAMIVLSGVLSEAASMHKVQQLTI